jgi:hypothetical protein
MSRLSTIWPKLLDVAAQPTFEQIFTHVRGYLTFQGPDKDPYTVAS